MFTTTNYQAKIWLPADCLKAVRTRLPPIPDACVELVICRLKSKCRMAQRKCFKKNLNWTYACGCDGVHCCNPAGQYTRVQVNVTCHSPIALNCRLDTSLRCIHNAYENIRVKRPSVQYYFKMKTVFRKNNVYVSLYLNIVMFICQLHWLGASI